MTRIVQFCDDNLPGDDGISFDIEGVHGWPSNIRVFDPDKGAIPGAPYRVTVIVAGDERTGKAGRIGDQEGWIVEPNLVAPSRCLIEWGDPRLQDIDPVPLSYSVDIYLDIDAEADGRARSGDEGVPRRGQRSGCYQGGDRGGRVTEGLMMRRSGFETRYRGDRGAGRPGAAVLLALLAGCASPAALDHATSGASSPGASSSTPADPCLSARAQRGRVPGLLAEGRLDRVLRVLDRADSLCPADAPSSAEARLTTLVALGRDSEAREVARRFASEPGAPATVRDAVAAALARIEARSRPPTQTDEAWAASRALLVQARSVATGNPAAALPLFEKAWETSHPNGTALVGAGMAAAALGRAADAQRFFDRAMVDIARATSTPVVAVVRTSEPGIPSPDGLAKVEEDGSGNLVLLDRARLASTSLGPGAAGSVAFDRQGRTLVTAAPGEGERAPSLLRLREVATAREIASLSIPGLVSHLSFSPDGKSILASGASVFVWDPPAKKPKRVFPGSHAYAIGPDDRTLAITVPIPAARLAHPGVGLVASETIDLVELASGRVIKSLASHEPSEGPGDHRVDSITSIAFAPDGGMLAASLWTQGEGPRDRLGGVHLFALPSGAYKSTLRPTSDDVRGPLLLGGFTPDGKRLMTAPEVLADAVAQPDVELWDLGTGKVIDQFSPGVQAPPPEWARATIEVVEGDPVERGAGPIEVDPTGHRIAFGSLVVDLDAREDLVSFPDSAWSGKSASALRYTFTDDGRLLLARSMEGAFEVRDLRTGKVLDSVKGSKLGVVSADGRVVAARVAGGVEVHSLGGSRPPEHLAASDSTSALLLSRDGSRLWDGARLLDRGRPTAVPRTPPAGLDVRFVAMSPDGAVIVAASGPSITLWLPETGVTQALSGHREAVRSLAVSADGKVLLSADPAEIRLWTLPEGQPLGVVAARGVTALGVMPGDHVFFSAQDGKVTLRRLPDGAPLGLARTVERGLSIQADDGSFEVLGVAPAEILRCRAGAFTFPEEVCAERWRAPGLLRRLLAGDRSPPAP